MKIKRLEIIGFKSFVDKVSLDFQNGITGVVGPNGCGKSNIVDAIRWAMGEQNARLLRGRMMEDVIFGGSDSRKPHGLAQVSIVFDNSAGLCPPVYKNFSEIMVTRCLHRNGDSEYRINKTPCRLLDITELFMDTGVGARSYSIIEQGKVGMLVSAKPEERRSLIEEAAGVTKYKARKKTALRKMDATRQNLIRLGDIITEVRRQIGHLKRQAQKAERFRDYRRDVKRIELTLGGNRYRELKREEEIVSTREQEQATILARLDARLEEGDLQLSEQQLQLTSAEAEFGQAQERFYHLGADIQKAENELLLTGKQREHQLSMDEELKRELESLAGQLRSLEEEHLGLVNNRELSETETCRLQELVDAEEARLQGRMADEQSLSSDYEQSRNELMELVSQANRIVNRREDISRSVQTESNKRDQIQQNSQAICQQQEQLQNDRQRLLSSLDGVKHESEILKERLEEWQRLHQVKDAELNQRQNQLAESQQGYDRALSMFESLQELQRNREGYADGTRALLSQMTDSGFVLADLIRVAEENETIVEAALGERLQSVAVGSIGALKTALRTLADNQLRGALMLQVDGVERTSFKAGTPMRELVVAQPGFETLADQIFSDVYSVSDVTEFLNQALPAGVLLVDDAGRCLDWRGSLVGGVATGEGAGLLRRQRQLDELETDIERRKEAAEGVRRDVEQLEEELLEVRERCSSGQSESHRYDLQLVELGKDRQRLQTEEDHLNKRLELIVHDLEQLDEGRQALTQEDDRLKAELETIEIRRNELQEQTATLVERLAEARGALDSEREQLTRNKVALAASQQQQRALLDTLKRVDGQLTDIRQRRTQVSQRLESAGQTYEQLDETEKRLRIELDVLFGRREELQKEVDSSRQQYEDRRASIEEFRDQLRRVRAEAEEIRKTVSRLQVRQHELQVDKENVRQNVLERYRVDLVEHQIPEATEDEIERQQQQLKRLLQHIDALGEVNLMAIDEYREQEERYDFLNQQRDDLNKSLEDLQKAISQINRTTRRRFRETFDRVNEKFKQVFPRLFRGGQAELRLTDESDLLETGIEIIVQPPGKRLQNVNLLSGGEKALTAVALIFSLFLIKPTPFCILDEVDAPLDDANIDRFAEIVREMTELSQFVIITHSKRTMAVLDTMYGVTMQEPGVSKLVSVRMNSLDDVADRERDVPVSA